MSAPAAAAAAADAAVVERYINITDVIKRANIEIEQCTRIATTSEPKLQKMYATAAVLNIMLILKDLSDGREALLEEERLEREQLKSSKDICFKPVFVGIINKIKMMHIMIQNMVRIYNIDYNNYKYIIDEAIIPEEMYTAPTTEDRLYKSEPNASGAFTGTDVEPAWLIGRGKEGTLYGFGLPPPAEDKAATGGFRKSRRNIRKSIKRISTRRN